MADVSRPEHFDSHIRTVCDDDQPSRTSRGVMSRPSFFSRAPVRTLSPVATEETFESRFWTTMVIIAFFFFYLFTPADEGRVSARA
jgi:hypothetical protein